jgi:Ser/Thr protein kinase RdoA (MazF antagonist)
MAKTISRQYEISAHVECTLLKPSLNDTYLVRSRTTRWVARVYGAHRRSTDIAYELELLRHLRAGGVSVAESIPAADGCLTQRLEAPEGVRELAVFRYVDGEPMLHPDEQHYLLWGRLAAEIHGGADSFVSTHTRSGFDLEHLAYAPLRSAQTLLADRPEDWSFLVQLAGALGARVTQAVADGLDWGPCHGDFGAKNIHIEGSSLTALDFERCGAGWRAYDFAPVYRATRVEGKNELWEVFVRGYTSLRPLSPSDLAAVPVFRVLRQLEMLGTFASNAPRWGAHTALRTTLGLLASLRKLAVEDGFTQNPGRPALIPEAVIDREEHASRSAASMRAKVSYSLLGEEALAESIEDQYAIEMPATCRVQHRGLNDAYLVLAPRERYVARVHRIRARSAEEIGYELDLLEHLSRRGISVALPLFAKDGLPTVALPAAEGTRHLVLFRHARGVPASWERPEHAYSVGKVAAQIHAATDDFSSKNACRPLDLEYLVTRPLAAIRPFLGDRSADWRCLCRVAGELQTRVDARVGEGLDWGACHGDLRPQHVYLDERGEAVVVGFAQCAPGWRVYDFTMMQWGSAGDDEQIYWRSFLRGYTDVRPLSPVELELLPVFHALRHLASLGSRAENAGEWGTRQIGLNVLDQELAFFREWEAENGGSRDDV